MTEIFNIFTASFLETILSSAAITILTHNSILDSGRGKYSQLEASDSIMDNWVSQGSKCSATEKTGTLDTPQPDPRPLKPSRTTPKERQYYLTTLKVPHNSPVLVPSASFEPLMSTNDFVEPNSSSEADTSTAEPLSSSASSFDLSFSTNLSEIDEPLICDASFSACTPDASQESLPPVVGLGLSGLTNKDSDAPFDGLGLVDIHGWIRQSDCQQHQPASQNPFGDTSASVPRPLTPSAGVVSSTFLQEALFTFMDDPFHEHSLGTIPECQSWYEMDHTSDVLEEHSLVQPNHARESETYLIGRRRGTGRLPRTPKTHFSSATISSELKRVALPVERMRSKGFRARSSTWPSTNSNAISGRRVVSEGGTMVASTSGARSPGWRV